MTEPREHEHDEREYGTLEKDLTSVVSQVQKLVNQYHDLQVEYGRLSEKIPEGLGDRVIKIELQLEKILDDLEKQYVMQVEFVRYKLEHAQMRYLMYGFIIMIMTSVVGAWLALIVHNASLIIK